MTEGADGTRWGWWAGEPKPEIRRGPAAAFSCFVILLLGLVCFASAGPLADEPLVDLARVDPTIVVELRYATERNIAGRAIYPPDMRCLVRQSVAERLKMAQYFLRKRGYGLKIWDAYRPLYAHRILWAIVQNPEYVGDPQRGGSLHSWGVAVDATLVDAKGRELRMPSDFDTFTPQAAMRYEGRNSEIARNLRRLQQAMSHAGFYGMRDEWWHFVVKNFMDYWPVKELAMPE